MISDDRIFFQQPIDIDPEEELFLTELPETVDTFTGIEFGLLPSTEIKFDNALTGGKIKNIIAGFEERLAARVAKNE